MQAEPPSDQNADNIGLTPTSQAKRKAGELLIHLCSKPPPAFLGLLDRVCVGIQNLVRLPGTNEMLRRLLSQASCYQTLSKSICIMLL